MNAQQYNTWIEKFRTIENDLQAALDEAMLLDGAVRLTHPGNHLYDPEPTRELEKIWGAYETKKSQLHKSIGFTDALAEAMFSYEYPNESSR